MRLRGPRRRPGTTDEAFVRLAYEQVLGRPADDDGLAHHLRRLAAGADRADVLLDLAASDEHRRLLARAAAAPAGPEGLERAGNPALEDLTARWPERYRRDHDVHGRPVLTFRADDPADFDWIEAQLDRTAYYEQGGIWSLEIDADKRLMAEVVTRFAPRSVLEIGCASGAVLSCLAASGIEVTGIDVSESARAVAGDDVRDRIVLGDLLEVDLDVTVDLVLGLDVFEHLNPNRLPAYLARAAALLPEGGWLVANIPAHGDDPVFGEVQPDYLDDGHPLHHRLHVDDRGYPLHGHLAWATWSWWQEQFEATGLRRAVAVERALQARYGAHLRAHTPARASMFVFRKGAADGDEAVVARRFAEEPSPALDT
jgi:SAM-dependent methyltransferase